jgi:hypothetical protein
MKIKKCKKCGGSTFIIQESILHTAELSPEDKNLTVYKEFTSGIDKIFCKNCEKEYLESDFSKINFR